MGFDLATGVLVVLGIAFLYLAFILVMRKGFKKPPPDQGVNEGSELTAHEPGHVGRDAPSDAENRQSAI